MMAPLIKCMYKGCTNDEDCYEGRFRLFPHHSVHDARRYKIWLLNSGNGHILDRPEWKKTARNFQNCICSEHFRLNCFADKDRSKRLRPGSDPIPYNEATSVNNEYKNITQNSLDNIKDEYTYDQENTYCNTFYECDVCYNKFYNVKLLERHKAEHGHYKCNVTDCSRLIFASISELSIHKTQAHGTVGSMCNSKDRTPMSSSPHLNNNTPHSTTVDTRDSQQINETSTRYSNITHYPNYNASYPPQQANPPVTFSQFAPRNQPEVGTNYFIQSTNRPVDMTMTTDNEQMRYSPPVIQLYDQTGAVRSTQYPGVTPMRTESPGERQTVIRSISMTPEQPIDKPTNNDRRVSLVLQRTENTDCYIIAQAKNNQGPIIHSVVGATQPDCNDDTDMSDLIPGNNERDAQQEQPVEIKVETTTGRLNKSYSVLSSPSTVSNSSDDDYEPSRKGIRKSKFKKRSFRLYKCQICPKKFDTLDDFNCHMRTTKNHYEEYQCTICYRRFESTDGLRKHIHMTTQHHDCNRCSAVFGTSRALSTHKKKEHRSKKAQTAIPIINLRSTDTLDRLSRLGVHHYIPLAHLMSLDTDTGESFGLPIIDVDGSDNLRTCNIDALGATSILTLGPLKHLKK